MHLTSIKISGFKTFIDPETIHFSSNLCAIVGPNGCGKSNIVDAIRWVMGEGSAKQLRGNAMADVIFSGSESRPPASRARVELIFDNSDGRIGNQYASFSEISVCRQLNMDGISRYFLNGQSCRRRDIFDVFSGTGLGPRGYSIIEQGMISTLIEAAPSELREHLEEAAGISKYKERRRETESRIQQTRQNLERLRDIRDEAKRLTEHLSGRVKVLEIYKKLKAQNDENQAKILYLRWQALNQEKDNFKVQLNTKNAAFETLQAKKSQLEAQLAARQTESETCNDKVNKLQAQHYELRATIVQEEADLKNHEQQLQQLQQNLQGSVDQRKQVTEQLTQGTHKGADLEKKLSLVTAEMKEIKLQEVNAQRDLQSAEENLNQWQKDWDEYQTGHVQALRTLDTQQHQRQHLQTLIEDIEAQIGKLQNEQLAPAASQDLAKTVESLSQQIKTLDKTNIKLTSELEKTERNLTSLTVNLEQDNHKLHQLRTDLEKLQGQKSSLEVWLANAAHSTDEKTQAWLAKAGLAEASYLSEKISVDPPWEEAVETALEDFLSGIYVEDLQALKTLSQLKDERITLVESAPIEQQAEQNAKLGLPLLSDRLPVSHPAKALLVSVYEAPNKEIALNKRGQLTGQQSIITPEGFWVSAYWIRFNPRQPESRGVLSSTARVRTLTKEVAEKKQAAQKLQKQIEQDKQMTEKLKIEQTAEKEKMLALQMKRASLGGDHRALQAQQKTQSERKDYVSREVQILQERLTGQKELLEKTKGGITEAEVKVQKNTAAQKALQATKETASQKLDEARRAIANVQKTRHEKELAYQSYDATFKNMNVEKETLSLQQGELFEKASAFTHSIEETKPKITLLQKTMQEKLDQASTQEEELRTLRGRTEKISNALKLLHQDKAEINTTEEVLRTELEQFRIDANTVDVKQSNELERLQETGYDIELVAQNLQKTDSSESLIKQSERINARIQKLGTINMAAAEEYEIAMERQKYLDEQDADMNAALSTLEEAIGQIDKETCVRFKQVFDEVNQNFSHFFPQCFGGGTAKLEMTGDNLLDTGVTVTVKPPGKKNSNIKSLSGGEKALTAVALVFSLFELNPSPFCALDEVDAPLDDANLVRYADLLRKMSERVQFIYITHNKISIESADQLIGVTMREPGVSRLIAVNIAEALTAVEDQ